MILKRFSETLRIWSAEDLKVVSGNVKFPYIKVSDFTNLICRYGLFICES